MKYYYPVFFRDDEFISPSIFFGSLLLTNQDFPIPSQIYIPSDFVIISTFGMCALIVGFAAAIAGVPTVGGLGQVTRATVPVLRRSFFWTKALRKSEVSLEVEVVGFVWWIFGGMSPFFPLFFIGDVAQKKQSQT